MKTNSIVIIFQVGRFVPPHLKPVFQSEAGLARATRHVVINRAPEYTDNPAQPHLAV